MKNLTTRIYQRSKAKTREKEALEFTVFPNPDMVFMAIA
jgi:hypothetical protein